VARSPQLAKLLALRGGRLLAALILLEMVFLLRTCAVIDDGFAMRSELESRPVTKGSTPPVQASSIVDQVHALSGEDPREVGLELPARRLQLAGEGGLFAWVALSEQLDRSTLLARLLDQRDNQHRRLAPLRPLTSPTKVINFCYNAASTPATFAQAWSHVIYPELQQTSLLPFDRSLDLVIISSYTQRACGGLLHLGQIAPWTPVLAPPVHPSDVDQSRNLENRLHNLIVLPLGYTALTSRLGAYVYETPPIPDLDKPYSSTRPVSSQAHYALVLLIRGKAGALTVLNGTEGLPLDGLLPLVLRGVRASSICYLGPTGYRLGSFDPELQGRLRRLHHRYPTLRVIPADATSVTARAQILQEFGPSSAPLIRGLSLPL
jgi:hypothetical protein